jgi:hypothetical protein
MQVIARRGENDEILAFALLNECLNGRKSGSGRATENKVAPVVFSQMLNKGIAGKSTVKEKYAIGRNMRQKALGLVSLGVSNSADYPGNRQLSKDIVGGHDETLGIVALAVVIQTASRVEFGAEFGRGGKAKHGAVKSIHGHLIPQKSIITRPEIIGQSNSPAQDVLENGPGDLFPCSGNVAAVRSVCVRPKTTAPGTPEKLSQFDGHALVLAARHKGKDKNDQFGEREFAVTSEIGV